MTYPRKVSWYLLAMMLLGGDVHSGQADPPMNPLAKEQFVNVQGGKYRLPGPDDCKELVLIFIGHDCPISNGYAPEVVRLCKEYTPKRIAFCVVYADALLIHFELKSNSLIFFRGSETAAG